MGLNGLLLIVLLTAMLFWLGKTIWRGSHPGSAGITSPVCGKCGYAVAGLEGWTCPECGSDLREVGIITPKVARKGKPGISSAITAWTFFILMAHFALSWLGAPSGIASQISIVQQNSLSPDSGAYRQVMWKLHTTEKKARGQTVPGSQRLQSLELQFTWDDRTTTTIEVASASDGDSFPLQITEEDVRKWLDEGGVDVEDEQVRKEIAELTQLIPQTKTMPRVAASEFNAGGLSHSSWGGWPGFTDSIVGWARLILELLIWIAGVVWIVRTHRREVKKVERAMHETGRANRPSAPSE